MPRLARKDFSTSFFHVVVQGINKEYIFDEEIYIEKYINLLNKYKKKFDVDILAYCIMNNHAHILIYVEDTKKMSGFMHSVNCIYAKYYNEEHKGRVGYVFRDRYLSEPIYNERYLWNCINYIHMNPVVANIVEKCEEYKYSSYNDFVNRKLNDEKKILIDIFGNMIYERINLEYRNESVLFLDVFDDNKSIKDIIKIFEEEKGRNIEEIKKDRRLLKELIFKMKNQYKIKYVDIITELKMSRTKLYRLTRKQNR